MQRPYPSIGLSLIICFLLFGFGLPKNIEKKVEKELQKTFQIDGFSLIPVELSPSINAKLPTQLTTQNFMKITDGIEHLGYLFVDKAMSKTAEFDYLVVFNTDLAIVHSKVLIYREEYGGEIGSKRWLRQFIGKTGSDRVDYRTNIDGISGATISVRSMTNAIDELLQSIGLLQKNQVL